MKRITIGATLLIAGGWISHVNAISWPFSNSDSTLNSYGQYQYGTVGNKTSRYMHPGLDIPRPVGTWVLAVENGVVTHVEQPAGDTLKNVRIKLDDKNPGEGWDYSHLTNVKVDKTNIVNEGDTVGWVGGGSQVPWKPHLHLGRRYFVQSIIPEEPWRPTYVVTNPLNLLPSQADGISPTIDSIWVGRDTTEQGLGSLRKVKVGIDSIWVVNHRIDAIFFCWDKVRDTTKVGVYKIDYWIDGKGTQTWKGHEFTGHINDFGRIDDADQDSAMWAGRRMYFYSVGVKSYPYVASNTFNNGLLTPVNLVGYWPTKQKQGGGLTDTATTNAEAKFPDGWYRVIGRAKDFNTNETQDTLQVIVNNFPPQVKQTYPDSGGVNFVSGDSIRILFDQPMDTASAKAAFHLQLKGSGSDVVGDTLFSGDTLLIFVPSDTLRLDTVYVVRIDATARDIADSTMLYPYEFPFSTQRTVLLFSVRDGANSISIQQFDSTATETLHVYQRYTGIGPTTGPMMCYDRQGNNYIVHWASVMGVNRVSRFSYTGGDSLHFLVGRKYRSITTDGDSLFLLQRSPADTMRYQYILKASLSGDSGSCFFMSSVKGWTAGAVWYNPWDSLLYVTWEDTSQANNNKAFVRKYQRNGQQVGGDLETSDIHGKTKLIVVNDRVAMIRAYPGSVSSQSLVTFHWLSNWYSFFYVNLTPYDPYGGVPWVWGATASPTHLYVTARSYLGGTSYGNWIARFDRNGNFLDALLPPDGNNTFCGAMAAFPPAIRFPKATYTPPDQGDDGGGGQTAELNSLLPRVYALGQSYPNPAKDGLRIDYALPKESQVNLRIYNVAGQLVRTLREGKEKPGFYKAEWDGKDQLGKRVASGVYLYRMEAGEFRKTRKLVVVR